MKALKADGHLVTLLRKPWSYASIYEQCYTHKPDVVVHLAACYRREHRPDDLPEMLTANVGLITVVCEAMRARGVTRLVLAGTAWQDFNGAVQVPANLYAATKNAAAAIVDYYVDAHAFRVLDLRLINLYGPGDTRTNLLTTLHDGMALTGGEQQTAFVPVDEAVAAVRTAIDQTATMPSGRQPVAIWDDVKSLREWVTQLRPEVTPTWGALPYPAREPMYLPIMSRLDVPVSA